MRKKEKVLRVIKNSEEPISESEIADQLGDKSSSGIWGYTNELDAEDRIKCVSKNPKKWQDVGAEHSKVTFSLIGEIQLPDENNEKRWMRFYYNGTEQMGIVTCNDAPPKLYKNSKREYIKNIMYKVKGNL